MNDADLLAFARLNPVASEVSIANATGTTKGRAAYAIRRLIARGFDRDAAAQDAVEKWRAINRGATVEEIARHFGTTETRIYNILRRAANDDRAWLAARCLRPAWYVEEIATRGYLGIYLPREEFLTYLEYYNAKKTGRRP